MDNDGDGFVDCDDWDCQYNPDVTVCTGDLLCAWTGATKLPQDDDTDE